ncbi:MAG: hypothetical protein HC890_06180 [Chloroflexaceae bacterium]|nr:hypothetical protein [Chloroflexaceae bacterium]
MLRQQQGSPEEPTENQNPSIFAPLIPPASPNSPTASANPPSSGDFTQDLLDRAALKDYRQLLTNPPANEATAANAGTTAGATAPGTGKPTNNADRSAAPRNRTPQATPLESAVERVFTTAPGSDAGNPAPDSRGGGFSPFAPPINNPRSSTFSAPETPNANPSPYGSVTPQEFYQQPQRTTPTRPNANPDLNPDPLPQAQPAPGFGASSVSSPRPGTANSFNNPPNQGESGDRDRNRPAVQEPIRSSGRDFFDSPCFLKLHS